MFALFFTSIIYKTFKILNERRKGKLGSETSLRYILFFSTTTLLPSIIIAIFSLFLFNVGLQRYFDDKIKSINKLELVQALSEILSGNSYVPDSYKLLTESNSASRLSHTPDRGLEAVKLGITYRQYEVLMLISQGLTNKDISEKLNVKECTIKSHVQVLFQILNVKNRTACSVEAKHLKLLPEANVAY